MNPELNKADGNPFESTVRNEYSTDNLSLTLSAARAAAGSTGGANDTNGLTKEEKERRKRAKKRRLKKEQRAVAAAEAAAAAAGIQFTGTMKRTVAEEALKALGESATAEGSYDEEAFEADDEDNYSDDFEADTGPSKQEQRRRRSKNGKSSASSPAAVPAFETVSIGHDAGFEATVGGTRRSRSSKKKSGKDKDAFGETYSRAGLPGRRAAADSDDDEHSLTAAVSHARRVSGDDPLPIVHGRAPSSGMPTARGHSPRSSPPSSHYQSDSNQPLPNINSRRR